MPTTTVDIHIVKHGYSRTSLESLATNALELGFPDVDIEEVTTEDGYTTFTVTLTHTVDRHDGDTSVRTAVENVLSNAPVHVAATETKYDMVPVPADKTPQTKP